MKGVNVTETEVLRIRKKYHTNKVSMKLLTIQHELSKSTISRIINKLGRYE